MRKMMLLTVFVLLFGLMGCSQRDVEYEGGYEEEQDVTVLLSDTPTRKIIYQVRTTLQVTNVNTFNDELMDLMEADEWMDRQQINGSNAYYELRIRTDRLDTFIEEIKDRYAINHFEKEGTDVSLQYQDKTNRMTAIDLQLERLLTLYETASLSEMITINKQISELEVEKQKLNGELLVYDSLIDYSLVIVSVYGSTVVTKSPFINRLGRAFESGWIGLVSFLDGLIILIATILPFGVIFGLVGGSVVFYIKHKNKKYDLKKKMDSKL